MGLFMVSQLYYNNWFGRFQANWGELFGAKKILGFLWWRRRNKLFHNEENRQIDKEVSSERTVCVCNFYLQLANSSLLFTHKCQRGCLLLISITAPQRDGHAEITGNTQPINPNIPRIISRFYMKMQFIIRFFMWKKPNLANYQILKVPSKEASK